MISFNPSVLGYPVGLPGDLSGQPVFSTLPQVHIMHNGVHTHTGHPNSTNSGGNASGMNVPLNMGMGLQVNNSSLSGLHSLQHPSGLPLHPSLHATHYLTTPPSGLTSLNTLQLAQMQMSQTQAQNSAADQAQQQSNAIALNMQPFAISFPFNHTQNINQNNNAHNTHNNTNANNNAQTHTHSHHTHPTQASNASLVAANGAQTSSGPSASSAATTLTNTSIPITFQVSLPTAPSQSNQSDKSKANIYPQLSHQMMNKQATITIPNQHNNPAVQALFPSSVNIMTNNNNNTNAQQNSTARTNQVNSTNGHSKLTAFSTVQSAAAAANTAGKMMTHASITPNLNMLNGALTTNVALNGNKTTGNVVTFPQTTVNVNGATLTPVSTSNNPINLATQVHTARTTNLITPAIASNIITAASLSNNSNAGSNLAGAKRKRPRRQHVFTDRRRRSRMKAGIDALRTILAAHDVHVLDQVSVIVTAAAFYQQLTNQYQSVCVSLQETHNLLASHGIDFKPNLPININQVAKEALDDVKSAQVAAKTPKSDEKQGTESNLPSLTSSLPSLRTAARISSTSSPTSTVQTSITENKNDQVKREEIGSSVASGSTAIQDNSDKSEDEIDLDSDIDEDEDEDELGEEYLEDDRASEDVIEVQPKAENQKETIPSGAAETDTV